MRSSAARPTALRPPPRRRAVPRATVVIRAAVLAALVALVASSACTSGRAPVFDRPRSLGARTLLLGSEIRLGREGSPVDLASLSEHLDLELRRALGGAGVVVQIPADADRVAALRRALLEVWVRGRQQGLGRLRTGTDLALGPLLGAAAESGSSTVMLGVLTRTGTGDAAGGYVPRPPGEVIRMPEDRFEHEIPQAGRNAFGAGVDLDLLAVDVATGKVVAHRRVSHPAAGSGDIVAAVPVLVREAARGFAPSDPARPR